MEDLTPYQRAREAIQKRAERKEKIASAGETIKQGLVGRWNQGAHQTVGHVKPKGWEKDALRHPYRKDRPDHIETHKPANDIEHEDGPKLPDHKLGGRPVNGPKPKAPTAYKKAQEPKVEKPEVKAPEPKSYSRERPVKASTALGKPGASSRPSVNPNPKHPVKASTALRRAPEDHHVHMWDSELKKWHPISAHSSKDTAIRKAHDYYADKKHKYTKHKILPYRMPENERMTEEVKKQLDELSKDTLRSYVKKADRSIDRLYSKGEEAHRDADRAEHKPWGDMRRKDGLAYGAKARKRERFANLADKKIAESEQINELSKKTLLKYIEKASSRATSHAQRSMAHDLGTDIDHPVMSKYDDRNKKMSAWHAHKALNREFGIVKAAKKLAKESEEMSDLTPILEFVEEKNLVDFKVFIKESLVQRSLAMFVESDEEPELDLDLDDEEDFDLDDLDITQEELDWIVENITEEEFEQLDELSKNTLRSYTMKAARNLGDHAGAMGNIMGRNKERHGNENGVDKSLNDKEWSHHLKKKVSREMGINVATAKLAPETAFGIKVPASNKKLSFKKEEVEDLEEGRGAKGRMRHPKEEDEWGSEGRRSTKKFDLSRQTARKMKSAMREDEEQEGEVVTELSKKVLTKYLVKNISQEPGKAYGQGGKDTRSFDTKFNRALGRKRAEDRLAKEETEQLDELSKKAQRNTRNRVAGVFKATDRLTKEENENNG